MKSVTMMRIAIKKRKITQEKLCEYFGLNKNTSFVYEVIGMDLTYSKFKSFLDYTNFEIAILGKDCFNIWIIGVDCRTLLEAFEDILELRGLSYSELERRYGMRFNNIKRSIDIGEIKMYKLIKLFDILNFKMIVRSKNPNDEYKEYLIDEKYKDDGQGYKYSIYNTFKDK